MDVKLYVELLEERVRSDKQKILKLESDIANLKAHKRIEVDTAKISGATRRDVDSFIRGANEHLGALQDTGKSLERPFER